MRTIRSTTRIDAPLEVVWGVITDFPAYGEWNPFITSLEGELRVGARLRATFDLPGQKPRTFTPKVIVLEPGRRLTWLGRLLMPGLFDGEHGFEVRQDGPGTEFVQTEQFRGLLPPLLGRMLASTEEAFVEMNAALKRRAESTVA